MDYGLGTLLVSAISGIAAIVIATFAIIHASSAKTQAEASKTQANLMKKEMESRLRPWVSPVDIVAKWITLKDTSVMPYKTSEQQTFAKKSKAELKNIIYEIEVKNTGSIPAKTRIKILTRESKVEKKNLEEVNEILKSIIMPGETEYFSVEVKLDFLKDGGIFYAGILLEYDLDKKRISKICKIWRIDKQTRSREIEWIDDPDLDIS